MQARDEQFRTKAARAAAARAEVEADKRYAEQLAEAEAEAQARKMAGIRGKALTTQDFIKTQMAVSDTLSIPIYTIIYKEGWTHFVRSWKVWWLGKHVWAVSCIGEDCNNFNCV